MTTLKDIGEFGFIKRFSENFKDLPAGFEGIGDDCAVMPYNDDEFMLITTDMLVEGQHFLSDVISPFELGYKSLAVNLSDIAAMGGRPVSAFLSLGVRHDTKLDWLDEFFKGLKHLSGKTGTLLLGGDTTKVPDGTAVNIAVIGKVRKNQVKRRSGASPGDIVVVTGNLGDSGGGLKAIQQKLPANTNFEYLIKRHHLPRPHLEEGEFLSGFPGVTAMLDVSDGIGSDIKHIMEKSKVGAKLHLEKLPTSRQLIEVCETYQWDKTQIALGSGEDYCLLLTIKADVLESIKKEFERHFNQPLYVIGEVTNSNQLEYFSDGEKINTIQHGFDHFQ